jgi:hypothetical protein
MFLTAARARLTWRRPQVVLWGGREWLDTQYGEPFDRAAWERQWRVALVGWQQRKMQARLRASMIEVSLVFNDAFSPAMRQAAETMAEFGRVYGDQMRRGLAGWGRALADAGLAPPDERSGRA